MNYSTKGYIYTMVIQNNTIVIITYLALNVSSLSFGQTHELFDSILFGFKANHLFETLLIQN